MKGLPKVKRIISELIIQIVAGIITYFITYNIIIAAGIFAVALVITLSIPPLLRFIRIIRSGGIINVFENQMSCKNLIAKKIEISHRVAILAVQAFHIIRPVDAPFFKPMTKRGGRKGAPIRLCLLNPEAHGYVRIRAKEMGEKEDDFIRFIQDSIVAANDLKNSYSVDIQVKLYSKLPVWQLFIFDDCLFVSFYSSGVERHRQKHYQIAEGSPLYHSFVRYFNYLWDTSVKPQRKLLKKP